MSLVFDNPLFKFVWSWRTSPCGKVKVTSSLPMTAHGVKAWFCSSSCLFLPENFQTRIHANGHVKTVSSLFWLLVCGQPHFNISLCNSLPRVVSWVSLDDTWVITRNQSQSCYRPSAQRPPSGVLVPLRNLTLLVSQGMSFWSHNPLLFLFHHSRTTVQSFF